MSISCKAVHVLDLHNEKQDWQDSRKMCSWGIESTLSPHLMCDVRRFRRANALLSSLEQVCASPSFGNWKATAVMLANDVLFIHQSDSKVRRDKGVTLDWCAGISTSCGIPDFRWAQHSSFPSILYSIFRALASAACTQTNSRFHLTDVETKFVLMWRGPKGVWTLKHANKPVPAPKTTFIAAKPSLTHQVTVFKLPYLAAIGILSLHINYSVSGPGEEKFWIADKASMKKELSKVVNDRVLRSLLRQCSMLSCYYLHCLNTTSTQFLCLHQ